MSRNVNWIVLAVIILGIILVAWYLFLKPIPQGPQPQPYVSNITVLSSNGSNINGIYIINGIVQNKNSFIIKVVNINATGYSSNGTIVDTGSGFNINSPIAPGGISNFTVALYDPNTLIKSYKVQVEDASR